MRGWMVACCGVLGACEGPGPDAFADAVVSFVPGDHAGFGEASLPDVVLGPPEGRGDVAGSLDVLSLGCDGSLVLRFDDVGLVDGPGPDLLVFENPFQGFVETGEVAVSDDGLTWAVFPCDLETGEGCAGLEPVYANSDNGLDPTDPAVAGGDAFDLADVGVTTARFVRVTDAGDNVCDGVSGGFDLDAVAVVNGALLGTD